MLHYLSILIAEEVSPFLINPDESNGQRFFWEFINMLSTLGIVLVALLVVVWVLKRFNQGKLEQLNSTSAIRILERRAISQKSVLYLVEIEGTALVFAESTNGVTQLSQFELESKELIRK